MDKNIYANAA